MVLGDAIILGSSGETASIFAKGTSQTDSVYASKDGKTLQGVWSSKVVEGVTVYGFLIDKIDSYGTWTLTASNGTQTQTYSVLVDMATQYDVQVSYRLYLYNQGDECTAVTGGWSFSAFWSNTTTSQTTITKNADNMVVTVYGTYGTGRMGGVATNNSIDLTNYSTLKVLSSGDGTSSVVHINYLAIGIVRSPMESGDRNIVGENTPRAEGIMSINISDISGVRYIACYCGQNATITQTIKQVWLE